MIHTDYRDPVLLEAFLRSRVREKTEVDKLDFKLDWTDQPKGKLELLKDINAIANTSSLDFDDHGFLIFGMNRTDGQVTRNVELLARLGVDKLESQVAQLVQGHMSPAPEFSLYQFEELGVGIWGALVIWPNQAPPFVFSKPGTYKEQSGKTTQLWRAGEWRLRRLATTVEPTPADYAQMLRARIQGATAPLLARIDQLQDRVAQLEGKVEALGRQASARVSAELLLDGEVAGEVTFNSPEVAGRAVLAEHTKEVEALLSRMKLDRRKNWDNTKPDRMALADNQWAESQGEFSTYLLQFVSRESRERLEVLQAFLTRWQIHGAPEDRDLSQVWPYKFQRTGKDVLLGADQDRGRAYQQLLVVAEQIFDRVERAARFAPYREFSVRLHNESGQPTGKLQIEIAVNREGELYRFTPKDRTASHAQFSNYSAFHEVRLERVEEQHEELLPGASWETQRFALRFDQPGEVLLSVRVMAQRLPEPQVIRLPFSTVMVDETGRQQ